MQTRQTDHAVFLVFRNDGSTQKFTSIQIETTKLRSTWWVDDILHLLRRRQDQEVPRVDTSRSANATNGPCYLTLLSKIWRHAKIHLHPNRNDQLETHLVRRPHPAPPATKGGPGGTSSRYFEVSERDKRTMLSYFTIENMEARKNSRPSKSKRPS